MIKIKSAKAKGRTGQQEIVKILLNAFPELSEDDIKSTPMGTQGEDIMLSAIARRKLPWNIEVKRGKAFNLVKAVKQAEQRLKIINCPNKDCIDGIDQENFNQICERCKGIGKITYRPIALGRYDRDKKWYATIELEYLIELLGRRMR